MRIFLTLILLISSTSAAIACSCLPPPPPLEAMDQMAAVFMGKALSRAENPTDYTATYRIEVSLVWKGVTVKEVEITTGLDSGMCGVDLIIGEDYLIYAREYGGELHTDICTRTRAAEYASEDLAALGEPSTILLAQPETFGSIRARF